MRPPLLISCVINMSHTKLIAKQKNLRKAILVQAEDFASTSHTSILEDEAHSGLNLLEKRWAKFEDNNAELEELNANGELDSEAYFLEDWYQEICRAYLKFHGALLRASKASSSRGASSAASTINSSECTNQATLPKLPLPKFSGRYEEWVSFHDRFQSLVDGNTTLAQVDKLQYLISCLSGDAAMVIANIPIQSDNYTRAYEKLRSRYENKRSIVNAHLDTLFSLKTVTRKCAKSLEQVRSTVANTIEALTALGGSPKDWDYFLVYLISKKLDSETQEAWELSIGASTEPPTYSSLDEFLASRVRGLESLGARASAAPGKPQPERQSHAPSRGARVHTVSPASVSCPLCPEQHLLFQCEQYRSKTPQQRHRFLQENKRCYNCLSNSHNSQACRSEKRCNTCRRKHHSTIHDHVVHETATSTPANPAESPAGTSMPSSPPQVRQHATQS